MRPSLTPPPVCCRECGHWYTGTICNICKEPSPAYRALLMATRPLADVIDIQQARQALKGE